jgi:hypothetical protein
MRNRLQDYSPTIPGPVSREQTSAVPGTPERILQAFTACVAEHPTASLLVMASLGAVVGWYLKRR